MSRIWKQEITRKEEVKNVAMNLILFRISWHVTGCIAEVRIFDAGSARNHSKIEKQKKKNELMLTNVRLPGQLIVSDQMLIISASCPYFGNTFVVRRLFPGFAM